MIGNRGQSLDFFNHSLSHFPKFQGYDQVAVTLTGANRMANTAIAPLLSPRFMEALQYATELHNQQLRKGTPIPYVAHLLGVCSLALEYGADEDEAIAVLLHDAIEDQGGDATRQEIRQRFGDRVTEIVNGCTDAEVEPKPPWRDRKEAYITHLETASTSVRLVSACDKLHNARAILRDYRHHGESLWQRFKGGKDGTLWYYRALVTAFRQFPDHSALIDELDRVVTEMETLSSMEKS
jgi:GTP pyrophosphokinase